MATNAFSGYPHQVQHTEIVIWPLTGVGRLTRTWTRPQLSLVFGDGEKNLHGTTSPLIYVHKPALPLTTAVATTLQDTLKGSLGQGVVQGHMTKPDQLTPLDL